MTIFLRKIRRGRIVAAVLLAVCVLAVLPARADTFGTNVSGSSWPDPVPGNGKAAQSGTADQYGVVSVSASADEHFSAGPPAWLLAPLPGQSVARAEAGVTRDFPVTAAGTYEITATFAPVTGVTSTQDDLTAGIDSASMSVISADLSVNLTCSLDPCSSVALSSTTTERAVACSNDGVSSCGAPGGMDLTADVSVPRDGDFSITSYAFLRADAGARAAGLARADGSASIYRIYIEKIA